ncbi:hypothetical protein DFO45_2885 [Azorhizobium sp. AG788]|uniref:esterase-like activity of phytase family protein n=1 Tax=Azorhizobium sp. AG788 TaxID=2183897 RepID=UPI001060C8C3|nr:esterase-like activity of phytase family protein [Azorhizobium sp. AG788]TDT93508.1 hypothetical protein DFO45_2885 [Azorhizobium sp. AG788]
MRSFSLTLAVLLAGTALATSLKAEETARAYPATVEGHVVLPAATYIQPPADAPADLKVAGKFTAPDRSRNDQVGSVPGVSFLSPKDAPRATGISMPFPGQAVQGFSGIVNEGNGTFLVITDNGFGSKFNSPDAMLMVHRLAMDFKAGTIERKETLFLRDPDKKVPFPITFEGTPQRYLTGSDFDIESIQKVGDSLWFGEELGPFLVETDLTGKVKGVYATKVDGKVVRSPDNPAITTPPNPSRKVAFEIQRSKGFEGMALSPDGTKLYALLEGPVLNPETGEKEKVDGAEVLRILEFDLQKKEWTGRFWKYPLSVAGNAIGDFNMIDATSGLIIERDDVSEGTPSKRCPEGKVASDCFDKTAQFKRVYKVEFSPETASQLVRKVGYVDLMALKDPNGKAKQGGKDGMLDFPFITIENVVMVDPTHIVVGNDNNLPFSAGRDPNKADDNEFVLLEVGELLKAK